MSYIFVDCEGINVLKGTLTEFGAVEFESRKTFHGDLRTIPLNEHPTKRTAYDEHACRVFNEFDAWLSQFPDRPIFVSDNPAYDWQGINYGFLRYLSYNPFGHSARRISDFYAGMCDSFIKTQEWKKLRITKHTHHPVDDAMGNVEAMETLLAQVERRSACWEWKSRDKDGYGRTTVNRRSQRVHRVVWEAAYGPIPEGMCVLHHCDNPPCFNIKHLFLGTSADNVRDMDSKERRNSARPQRPLKTHCKHGHPFTDENTYTHQGKRHCQTCRDVINRKASAERTKARLLNGER